MRFRPYNGELAREEEMEAVAQEIAALTGEDVCRELLDVVEEGITHRPTATFNHSYTHVSRVSNYRKLRRGDEIILEGSEDWIHGRVRDNTYKTDNAIGQIDVCDRVCVSRGAYNSIEDAVDPLRRKIRPTSGDDPLCIIFDPKNTIFYRVK